jgi:hypothetical protein
LIRNPVASREEKMVRGCKRGHDDLSVQQSWIDGGSVGLIQGAGAYGDEWPGLCGTEMEGGSSTNGSTLNTMYDLLSVLLYEHLDNVV